MVNSVPLREKEMSGVPQTRESLQKHLAEQLGFLLRSARSYDKGYVDEAKRLATTIRILVHDTSKSMSLLGQLGLKSLLFYDTAVDEEPKNILPHGGLIQMVFGEFGATYFPYLDGELSSGVPRSVPFDEWWNRVIFRNKEGHQLSRRDLVLAVANQDGGAHVDPTLNEAYSKLSREGGMGWVYVTPGKTYTIRPPELASVRQIAHEVLKTLKPHYEAHPNIPQGSIAVAGVSLEEVTGNDHNQPVEPSVPKVSRNDVCPCGSGKKYKKCHGSI